MDLVNNLKRDDDLGKLDGPEIGCYQVAFPNWLANNGACVSAPYNVAFTKNSDDCLKRLGISY